MNTYVMGEIAALLAVTAVAGILIGWCIKTLLSGRVEQQVRANVARDIDKSASDVDHLRANLHQKETELQDVVLELQQLRGRDVSLSAGNTTQVEEINDLKVELSRARQTLDQNRSEFAAFRNEKLQELQSVSNELASYKTGGSVHDKNMNQAHDSIAALRAAARENDKIIESLRARNKEADTTVENLRSQLKQSEKAQHEAVAARQERERASAKQTSSLQETSSMLEQQKRDYTTMLDTKNRDIAKHMNRLEELGSVQSLLKQKEHEFDKLNSAMHETARNTGAEISNLKRKLEISEQALSDSRIGIKNLQDQMTTLQRDYKTQTEQHRGETAQLQDKLNAELKTIKALNTRIENKDAEVVALNDMLRDVSGKRDQSVQQITQLKSQLQGVAAQQQKYAKSDQQMAALASSLKQREAEYAKLRSESDKLETKRSNLESQVNELQGLQSKLEQTDKEVEALRSQKQAAEEAQGQVAKLRTTIGNHESEIQQLKSRVKNADEQSQLIYNLQTTLKQKDAEVQKLRSTSDNISTLHSEADSLRTRISKKDTDLSDARLRVKNLTASLKSRDGEIQTLRKSAEEQKKVQLEANKLTVTLAQRDTEFDKLKTQMSVFAEERKVAAAEIQRIKSDQATEKSRSQSSESQRAEAYKKLQTEFDKTSKARDDYERRTRELQDQLDQQQKQFDEQLKLSAQNVTELQPQISKLQAQVSELANEKQQLTANLSSAETYKLKLTERNAEIRKLQIELRDAGSNGTVQTTLQDQTKKIDNLTSAMHERDEEISRLNQIITDNRVGSKQHSSEANLLKEEIDAQSKLIRSLEDQAENTLQLHKKIASQSTEIESLRADLHQVKSEVQTTPSVDYSHEIAQLKTTLAKREAELKNARSTSVKTHTDSHRNSTTGSNSGDSSLAEAATATPPPTSKKPRLYVRNSERQAIGSAQPAETKQNHSTTASAVANAEMLAGTQMPAEGAKHDKSSGNGNGKNQRALYTRDGYRLKGLDGNDDLSLLPGINAELADTLRKNKVIEFEQIALWDQREVSHFADRLGISSAKADDLQWTLTAKEILAGRYRVDANRETEKN